MEEKKSEGDGMCAGRLLAVAAASTSSALGETLGTKAMRIAALRPSQIDRVLLEKTS
jgi:hypothetical protein